ncbi:hypothetical protein A9239_15290 [Methanosarcina sp. A14]|nr:hypothetical protein A9239_15290 [Methanosarcina sp. A14]
MDNSCLNIYLIKCVCTLYAKVELKYAKIELDRLYENLQNDIGDMELFTEYVAQFLAKKKD